MFCIFYHNLNKQTNKLLAMGQRKVRDGRWFCILDLKEWGMAEKRGQEASWDAGVYFWSGFEGACDHFNWPVGIGSPSTGPQVRRTPERGEFTKRSGWTNQATDSCHRLAEVLGSFIRYLHISKGNNSVVWVVTFGDISLRLLWRNSYTENLLVPSQCWELPCIFPSVDKPLSRGWVLSPSSTRPGCWTVQIQWPKPAFT